MNKATVLTVIALLVLLAACGGKQMSAKPLAKSSTPTGDVVIHPPTPAATQVAQETSTKTAAEALKEFQQTQLQQAAASAVKSGSTVFYAPPNATAKSKGDARKLLLARTRSAFRIGKPVNQPTKSVTTLTSHYSKSGSSINLPKEYH